MLTFRVSARLLREGNLVGFPLLVKAARGGGGKGMKLARAASELQACPAPILIQAHVIGNLTNRVGFTYDQLLTIQPFGCPRSGEHGVSQAGGGRSIWR